MSDKKKIVLINLALEEEAKYRKELKLYITENPDFVPTAVKPVLTKAEKSLKERSWIHGESVFTEVTRSYSKYKQFLGFVFILVMEERTSPIDMPSRRTSSSNE